MGLDIIKGLFCSSPNGETFIETARPWPLAIPRYLVDAGCVCAIGATVAVIIGSSPIGLTVVFAVAAIAATFFNLLSFPCRKHLTTERFALLLQTESLVVHIAFFVTAVSIGVLNPFATYLTAGLLFLEFARTLYTAHLAH